MAVKVIYTGHAVQKNIVNGLRKLNKK